MADKHEWFDADGYQWEATPSRGFSYHDGSQLIRARGELLQTSAVQEILRLVSELESLRTELERKDEALRKVIPQLERKISVDLDMGGNHRYRLGWSWTEQSAPGLREAIAALAPQADNELDSLCPKCRNLSKQTSDSPQPPGGAE